MYNNVSSPDHSMVFTTLIFGHVPHEYVAVPSCTHTRIAYSSFPNCGVHQNLMYTSVYSSDHISCDGASPHHVLEAPVNSSYRREHEYSGLGLIKIPDN